MLFGSDMSLDLKWAVDAGLDVTLAFSDSLPVS
jgi:hypothetical protein